MIKVDITKTEAAVRMSNSIYSRPERHILIQNYSDGGYEYTVLDSDYKELDGGVYDDDTININSALQELINDVLGDDYLRGGLNNPDCIITEEDHDDVRIRFEEAEAIR